MEELNLRVYGDADEFADDWEALGYDTTETEQYWALLGELEPDELLIHLPKWLAEEKIGYIDGATPIVFVGRIEAETEKAIHLTESAAARPLSQVAHRIQGLEESITRLQQEGDPDTDRVAWLQRRLDEKNRALDTREDVPSLAEEWLPKSQIEFAGRRAPES